MRRVVFASLIALGSIGCDKIINSNVTETDYVLPSKTYSFDSSSFNIPSGVTQEVPCGAGQLVTDCCNPPAPAPAPDCTMTPLTCEQNENGTNVCMAQVTVSQAQMANLGQEVPGLSSLTSLVNITIKQISYEITANTLTVDVPDVLLYMAPQGVTDPNDSRAQQFGTLPAIPAMMTPSGNVALTPNAAQVFGMFTKNLQTPFNFIAATTLKVSKAPAGRIDMKVGGTIAASL
jgi:hypothetical protein